MAPPTEPNPMTAPEPRPEDQTVVLVSQIQGSVRELGQAVLVLTDNQAKTIDRLRHTVRWTILGLVLDTILTLLAGVMFHQERAHGQELDKAQASIGTNAGRIAVLQDRTSREALCPLYDLFLDAYDPSGPNALKDPAQYEQSFTVIESGSAALGCSHVKRGRD